MNIKPDAIVAIAGKSKHRRYVDFRGRFGRVIRVEEQRHEKEPAVYVALEATAVHGPSREWCWHDELMVI